MEGLQPVLRSDMSVDTFQAQLQDICGRFYVEPVAEREKLSSHLSVQSLAGLDIAQVGIDAHEVIRSKTDIRRDPGDHFFLILQREGRAVLCQNGAEEVVDPGDMFLVDSTQESRFQYAGDYGLQLSVHLPREEMLHRFGRRIYGGQKVDKSDPLGLSVRALLAKLCTDETAPQTHVVEAFYSVFGALLAERAQQTEDTSNPDRRIVQRALTLIAEHHHNPEFSTADLAEIVGVSLRRLQRSFQLIHETPHERLQSFRIKTARATLDNHGIANQRPSITTVAYQSGFGDLSTFYRTYKKTYGEAPGQAITDHD